MTDARIRELQSSTSQRILAANVDPRKDIEQERRNATFDPTALSYYLHGGKDKLTRRRELCKMVQQKPFADKRSRYFLSQEQQYVGGLQAALGIWEMMRKDGLSIEDALMLRSMLDYPGGLELHIGMYIPALMSNGDEQQRAEWLPAAQQLQYIGTYAQTELGHGTFVRGLETTATYDAATQQFVLHSPTLTSTKWWPGGLGKTATHAVVMARLFVRGRDHGPHAFMVQLRSLEDHKPLPGVTVGDIGPKFGYNGVDNGFLRFDHYCIPRRSMLMRYAKVLEDGTYVAPPADNAKAAYATMVFVRADIVRNASAYLSRAVTIATRYAAVRRQTSSAPGQPETQVLDYENTAACLLPLIATSYALRFMGNAMHAMYTTFERDRDAGNFSNLPQLHALSSGMKAVCTWATADGIEACRRCCGGHGYSVLSGLPTLYASYVQNVTWEGDNNVLCLQTARFIVKLLTRKRTSDSQPPQHFAYLLADDKQSGGCTAEHESQWRAAPPLIAALEARARALCRAGVARLLRASNGKAVTEGDAWNSVTVDLINMSRAHCELVLARTFWEGLDSMSAARAVCDETMRVLRTLACLFSVHTLCCDAATLLQHSIISPSQVTQLRSLWHQLLREVRRNAVALVDAFAFDDYELNSALGRHDGDVYSALLNAAQHSPLNDTEEGPAWQNVLKPVMHSRL